MYQPRALIVKRNLLRVRGQSNVSTTNMVSNLRARPVKLTVRRHLAVGMMQQFSVMATILQFQR